MAQTLNTEQRSGVFGVWPMTPEQYSLYWPNIAVELEKVRQFWEPWWTLDFLRGAMFNGIQVWSAGTHDEMRMVVYTQIQSYPSRYVFQIVLVLGNGLEDLLPILEASFVKIAHDWGCQEFEIIGRRGWGRLLQATEVATVFRKRVPEFGVH